MEITGHVLIDTVVELAQLPKGALYEEVYTLLHQQGVPAQHVTLDELRVTLLKYLEDIDIVCQQEWPEDQ